MNDFTLIDGDDDAGNSWTLCYEPTGEFVYIGYEFVPVDTQKRYRVIGGEPPSLTYPIGRMFVYPVGINGAIRSARSLDVEFFNFKWKRL